MKKALTRVFAIIMVFVIFICGIEVLNYFLIDNASSYTRLMMHEFYNQDNIDILCLGGSHCYRGIIPSIVSVKTGKKVFNASSSQQAPDASYAIIKEAIKRYDIEEVYLDISPTSGTGKFSARTQLTGTYIISDYMKLSLNKLMFLLRASSTEHYINSFIPSRRNWSSIMDFSYIYSAIGKKRTDTYKLYGYDYVKFKNEWYVGNGYVASKARIKDHMFYTTANPFNIDAISEDWENTIISIIEYCNKHDVKLTLFNTPLSYFRLSASGNYDAYIDYVRKFIKDRDVEYVDFSLLKDEYLPYKQTNYKDNHHLNMYGAEEFSNVFADYINGAVPDSAYYSSISEKLRDITPDYYGISYRDDEKNNTREIRLICNIPDYYEFRVEIVKSDGGNVLLQDYSTNNDIIFSKEHLAKSSNGSSPRLVVTYRRAETGIVEGRIEY